MTVAPEESLSHPPPPLSVKAAAMVSGEVREQEEVTGGPLSEVQIYFKTIWIYSALWKK